MTLMLKPAGDHIDIDPVDWPRCGICRMPVEKFSVTDLGDGLVFVAECHGDQETVKIPDSLWLDTVWSDLGSIGPAFTKGEDYDEFED
jgi:hypothetical protein